MSIASFWLTILAVAAPCQFVLQCLIADESEGFVTPSTKAVYWHAAQAVVASKVDILRYVKRTMRLPAKVRLVQLGSISEPVQKRPAVAPRVLLVDFQMAEVAAVPGHSVFLWINQEAHV